MIITKQQLMDILGVKSDTLKQNINNNCKSLLSMVLFSYNHTIK
jgi:hypothetical protein